MWQFSIWPFVFWCSELELLLLWFGKKLTDRHRFLFKGQLTKKQKKIKQKKQHHQDIYSIKSCRHKRFGCLKLPNVSIWIRQLLFMRRRDDAMMSQHKSRDVKTAVYNANSDASGWLFIIIIIIIHWTNIIVIVREHIDLINVRNMY